MMAPFTSFFTVLVLLLVVACDRGATPLVLRRPRPPRRHPWPLSLSRARQKYRRTRRRPAGGGTVEPGAPDFGRVFPRTLAASCQSYLGRRVSLACRPVRRIDFTRTLVVASEERFVIVGSPDLVPCGPNTSTFTVIGSSGVKIAGRIVLPELLLDEGGETGAR